MTQDADVSREAKAPGHARCFLHVPKSGGTSIHAALEAALPAGSLAPLRSDTSIFCGFREFELLKSSTRDLIAVDDDEARELRRYRAVSGHFSLPTLLQITTASTAIGTILREPRARILSLYLYWRTPNIFEAWLPYTVEEQVLMPLDLFLNEPRVAAAVDNQVCRMLLYGDSRIPSDGFIATKDIDAVASDAIDRLDTLGFVGVLELGDSAWRGFSRLFGVPLEPRRLQVTGDLVSLVGASAGATLINSDALELIERRSAADRIVYDHALARAGVGDRERLRLAEEAFARQLVRFGDLLGDSAARLKEQARAVDTALTKLEQEEQLQAQVTDLRTQLDSHERAVQELSEEIERRSNELKHVRGWLDAVHSSASWRMTAPLRAGKRTMRRRRQTNGKV